MIFWKIISNQEIETLILENISDFVEKFEKSEIDFWTNILIEELFKKFKSNNIFFKIIPNYELENLKKSFENIENEYVRIYTYKKNNMLWSPINYEKVNIFIENLNFCIKNNLEMIIFTEEGFNSGEHQIATLILKWFIIFLSLWVFLIFLFTKIIDFWVNSMLSEREKLESNYNFLNCKFRHEIEKKEYYENYYKECKKYKKFYNQDFTNLDKILYNSERRKTGWIQFWLALFLADF